jgi:hypothetical protein
MMNVYIRIFGLCCLGLVAVLPAQAAVAAKQDESAAHLRIAPPVVVKMGPAYVSKPLVRKDVASSHKPQADPPSEISVL